MRRAILSFISFILQSLVMCAVALALFIFGADGSSKDHNFLLDMLLQIMMWVGLVATIVVPTLCYSNARTRFSQMMTEVRRSRTNNIVTFL
jgi:hypothetical protein